MVLNFKGNFKLCENTAKQPRVFRNTKTPPMTIFQHLVPIETSFVYVTRIYDK